LDYFRASIRRINEYADFTNENYELTVAKFRQNEEQWNELVNIDFEIRAHRFATPLVETKETAI